MYIAEIGTLGSILKSVKFGDVRDLDKFATVANNRIVVWRKLTSKVNYLLGEDPDDEYTCPQPNAVTDTGFPAVFRPSCEVFLVDSSEYNDGVEIRNMQRSLST
jgi:hypothetical protein